MQRRGLEDQYDKLVRILKSERNDAGFWNGRLSSSALAAAVAIVALKINGDKSDEQRVRQGLNWLLSRVNGDGGFGDTPTSRSNVSTSLLCYAAISYCGHRSELTKTVLIRIETYLSEQKINITNGNVTSAVLAFYGKDYTFSVPILSMLIICGVLEKSDSSKIPQLPFEFTRFPSSWYSLFNLRVVSYAIPALISVGIFVFKTRKRHNPIMYWIRNRSIIQALHKLEKIVPQSGGFLEAIPLTAFVAMCLTYCGLKDNSVSIKGLTFLRNQQRGDGSWPIDTDLSTWVTTSSIKAVGSQMPIVFSESETDTLVNHLKTIQYKDIHPFNLAQPGGWGWTCFSGSVPDSDDTSGAILSLIELYRTDNQDEEAIINGCKWLTTLQNKDGGFPTFCKGWGRLPFDSSCADLTGHALLALTKSLDIVGDKMTSELQNCVKLSVARSFGFLWKAQNDNGCWYPLWFGNQLTTDQKNPVYGTSKVTIYLKDSILCDSLDERMKENICLLISRAQQFLLTQQNENGSWGGTLGVPGTIEESSLAISALIGKDQEIILKGFEWIDNEYIANGLQSSPIGLYFALLWYDEKMYPLVYYVEALRRFLK